MTAIFMTNPQLGMLKLRLLLGTILLLFLVSQASAGPNANATLSLDLIPDGGAGNQMDDGVHSGNVSGQGTKIAVEVFAKGVTTSLVGVKIEFDFKSEELKLDKVENSAFLFAIPEPTGINFAATAPVTLPESGFIGRAEFSTVADVTDKEFYLGIKAVTLAESAASADVIAPEMMATMSTINFNTRRTGGTGESIPTPPIEAGAMNIIIENYTEGRNLFGGASIVFTIDPAGATLIKGFLPAEGIALLNFSDSQVDVGSEQGVALSNGFLGTLQLLVGADTTPFTIGVSSLIVLLSSGEVIETAFYTPRTYNPGSPMDNMLIRLIAAPKRIAFVDANGDPVYIIKLGKHGAMTPLTVDFEDFVAFVHAFDTNVAHRDWSIFVQADLNDDGVVNFRDFILFFGSYGKEAIGPAHKSLLDVLKRREP